MALGSFQSSMECLLLSKEKESAAHRCNTFEGCIFAAKIDPTHNSFFLNCHKCSIRVVFHGVIQLQA